MKLKILKEVVILMIITTIMVSFVHADEDPYEKCVDECYSTCFADISGCYEYCKQDCKNPNLSSSEWKHCTINDCVKYKGGMSIFLSLSSHSFIFGLQPSPDTRFWILTNLGSPRHTTITQ